MSNRMSDKAYSYLTKTQEFAMVRKFAASYAKQQISIDLVIKFEMFVLKPKSRISCVK